MTREELYREIKRIDGFIEILQGFLKGPLCTCISHVNHQKKAFTEENKKHLHLLINIRKSLLTLQKEADVTLADIRYNPVKLIC